MFARARARFFTRVKPTWCLTFRRHPYVTLSPVVVPQQNKKQKRYKTMLRGGFTEHDTPKDQKQIASRAPFSRMIAKATATKTSTTSVFLNKSKKRPYHVLDDASCPAEEDGDGNGADTPEKSWVLSFNDALTFATIAHTPVHDVLKTFYRISALARECSSSVSVRIDEVRDALCLDRTETVQLGRLLARLYATTQTRALVDASVPLLPDSVFLMLGFLIFFAVFKFEQTGVDVNVGDAYAAISTDDAGWVTRKQFVHLFFAHGISDDVVKGLGLVYVHARHGE